MGGGGSNPPPVPKVNFSGAKGTVGEEKVFKVCSATRNSVVLFHARLLGGRPQWRIVMSAKSSVSESICSENLSLLV